jgi:hypothetical protein
MIKERTCNVCGRVAFSISIELATESVSAFNDYFYNMSEREREEIYGNMPSDIRKYEHCIQCGNHYSNFRDSIEGDCPIGVTLNPIIVDGYHE